MSEVAVQLKLTPESEQTIREFAGKPDEVRAALRRGLAQGLEEAATHLKTQHLSGRFRKGGGRTPGQVNLRSGMLRNSVITKRTEPLSGFVGVTRGPATQYAATILGDETTTITPKRSQHLWIPVADNLTRSGQSRLTPREALGLTSDSGKRQTFIVTSSRGNKVVLTRGPVPGTRQRQRPRLLFVLKDSVTVRGSGAMAASAETMAPRVRDILNEHIQRSLADGGGAA